MVLTRGGFDGLTFAVEAIELAREPQAFGGIILHEEIDAESGPADPTARIDARSQDKA